jgi:hypothetical protein
MSKLIASVARMSDDYALFVHLSRLDWRACT